MDGLGNRTAIFLQGCNIRCAYCHNPETQAKHDAEATEMSVTQVLDEVRKGIPFIRGITVSGGECMLQAEWLAELFAAVKNLSDECGHSLSCLIDSNGTIPFARYPQLMAHCDGVMLDVKGQREPCLAIGARPVNRSANRLFTGQSGCGNNIAKHGRYLRIHRKKITCSFASFSPAWSGWGVGSTSYADRKRNERLCCVCTIAQSRSNGQINLNAGNSPISYYAYRRT